MNKTLLKVLKYIGVACLGALVGIGALIGVSSCEAKKLRSANAEGESTQQFESISDVHGVYHLNYYEQINSLSFKLPKSAFDYSSSAAVPSQTFEVVVGLSSTGGIYSNVDDGQLGLLVFVCDSGPAPTNRPYLIFTIEAIYYNLKNDSGATYLYDVNDYFSDYNENNVATDRYARIYINRINTIYGQDGNYNGDDTNLTLNFLNILSVVLVPDEFVATFSFYDSWNYNAPYLRTTADLFIDESSFVNQTPVSINKTYYVGPFVSNGEQYDTIILTYFNGYGTRYSTDGTSYKTQSSSGFGYWNTMLYQDSNTGSSKLVSQRNFISIQSGSNTDLQTSLVSGSSWVNKNYQKLAFYKAVNDETNLAQFNNNLDVNGFNNFSGSVGLSDVFNIIALGFQSWLPIFNIQIIPGITIGLLLFMPLISGIIIFIIWIVKR